MLDTIQEDCQSFIVSRREGWISIAKTFKLRKWVALSDLNKKALPKSFKVFLAPESDIWENLSSCTQIKLKSLLTQFIQSSQGVKLLSPFFYLHVTEYENTGVFLIPDHLECQE